MKYLVWIIARDPKTLQPIAEVLVFENEDRLKAEHYNEGYTRIQDNAPYLFGPVVLGQNPIFNTETRIPGWGATASMVLTQPQVRQRCQCSPRGLSAKGRCNHCGRPL